MREILEGLSASKFKFDEFNLKILYAPVAHPISGILVGVDVKYIQNSTVKSPEPKLNAELPDTVK